MLSLLAEVVRTPPQLSPQAHGGRTVLMVPRSAGRTFDGLDKKWAAGECVYVRSATGDTDHLIQSRDRAERFSPVLLSIWAGTSLVSLFACFFELIIANVTKMSSVVLSSGLRIIRRPANCYAN